MARGTFVEKAVITTIPDGKYYGLWGCMNVVTVIADDGTVYYIHTDEIIDGNNVEVSVTVSDRKILVEVV